MITQNYIFNLPKNRERGISMLLMTHDISVVAKFAITWVMYGGRLMEYGSVANVFKYREHRIRRDSSALRRLSSEYCRHEADKRSLPDLMNLPQGCIFRRVVEMSGYLPDGGAAARICRRRQREVLFLQEGEHRYRLNNRPHLMQLKISIFIQKAGIFPRINIHVLKDVSLDIAEGEIVALVGESGCGKTTLGKIITGLYRPTSGDVYFGGERVSGTFDKKLSSYNQVQFIQQDSYAALNPVRTIFQSLYAPIKSITANGRKADRRQD
ncbi:MAG: ATP-binding cassette domain-containing protein [Christensenellaceae bacterium]